MDLEKELQDFMDYCEQIDLTWSTEINVLGLFLSKVCTLIYTNTHDENACKPWRH